jgi:hypothetical protein
MTATQLSTDPIALVDSLSTDAIVERLDTLEDQMDALRALLRVARARQRRAVKECKVKETLGL